MAVKIVTDSGSDISQEEARKAGVTVVPVYLRFGEDQYRDGVDIDGHEFYQRLATSPVHPYTSSPSPGDFARAYDEASRESDEIVSIHITSKHSATYSAAMLGKEIAEQKGCRIEVVDSEGVTMWQGLVVMAAAKAAQAQCTLHQVMETVRDTIGRLRGLALLDTMAYAAKGGRVGKAISAMESILTVKPLLTLRDGHIRPAGLVRTRRRGMDRLRDFVASAPSVEDLAIVYSTTPEDAHTLVDYARTLFPKVVPQVVQLGPALGVHTGPGAVLAVFKLAE
jgi:DegV family protein with EDD domain